MPASIVATGIYVPAIEVSNNRLRERFGAKLPEFVDKMEASSGIRTRWYAPDDWSTSDLALRASQKAGTSLFLAEAKRTSMAVKRTLLLQGQAHGQP